MRGVVDGSLKPFIVDIPYDPMPEGNRPDLRFRGIVPFRATEPLPPSIRRAESGFFPVQDRTGRSLEGYRLEGAQGSTGSTDGELLLEPQAAGSVQYANPAGVTRLPAACRELKKGTGSERHSPISDKLMCREVSARGGSPIFNWLQVSDLCLTEPTCPYASR